MMGQLAKVQLPMDAYGWVEVVVVPSTNITTTAVVLVVGKVLVRYKGWSSSTDVLR